MVRDSVCIFASHCLLTVVTRVLTVLLLTQYQLIGGNECLRADLGSIIVCRQHLLLEIFDHCPPM